MRYGEAARGGSKRCHNNGLISSATVDADTKCSGGKKSETEINKRERERERKGTDKQRDLQSERQGEDRGREKESEREESAERRVKG